MPEQATVEASDLEEIIALLREANGPLPLDTLVERYVVLLRERVLSEGEGT